MEDGKIWTEPFESCTKSNATIPPLAIFLFLAMCCKPWGRCILKNHLKYREWPETIILPSSWLKIQWTKSLILSEPRIEGLLFPLFMLGSNIFSASIELFDPPMLLCTPRALLKEIVSTFLLISYLFVGQKTATWVSEWVSKSASEQQALIYKNFCTANNVLTWRQDRISIFSSVLRMRSWRPMATVFMDLLRFEVTILVSVPSPL